MKKIILIATVLTINSAFAAGSSKWICFKKNDEIKVMGKSSAEKKANCLKQAGEWMEMVGSDIQKDPSPTQNAPLQDTPKQSAGGGGGW